ncbi:TPA: hypothetical protein ACGPXS_005001, partial [Escherichia coli]|nr:hypothetical protein [Escherichia coli]
MAADFIFSLSVGADMFFGDGGQLLSDKSLTGSAGGGNNRMKFNILPLAFFIGIIVSPARAELYFNPR